MKKMSPHEDLQCAVSDVDFNKESNVLKLICCLAMVLGLSVCVLTMTWKLWTGWIIEEDLRMYARTIRFSACSPADKALLLDEIESMQDRIATGTVTDFIRWRRHDGDLRELFAKNLQESDVPLLERELRRAARLIHNPDSPPPAAR